MPPIGYKLFITDLDGTLLDSARRIPQANLNAVRRLVASGVPATVFTGRNLNSAIDYVKELGVEVPVVFQNGALIWEPKSRKELLRIDLPAPVASSIVEGAREHHFDVIVYHDFYSIKDIWIDRRDWDGSPFSSYIEHNSWRIRAFADLADALIGETRIAQLAIIGPIGALETFRDRVKESFGSAISLVISTVRDNHGFLEIFGPRVSKGDALHFLLDHYGVSAAETVFIGDSYNDVDIMRTVGMPIAMGNAPADVQALCRTVVPDNDSCGVAEAISRLFFLSFGKPGV